MSQKNKTCALAWNHLATHPNGAVSLCCQAEMKDALGFAKTNNEMLFLGKNTLDEIRNSDSFKKVRLNMIAGIEPEACHRCYETERSGGRSKRMLENHLYGWKEEDAFTYVDGSIDSPLQFIELRLGNTCNLACVTCNSISSSKWSKDEKTLSKKIEWFCAFENSKQTRWFESEEFYENLASISKHVRKIYINGGEPLLIKQHKVLLQKLIDMGVAKNIHIEYSINLTIKEQDFINLWSHFQQVTVQFSIDAVGEMNDKIRRGSKFSEIQSNLEWYITNKPHNVSYIVCQTISSLNAHTVPDMEKFLEQYSLPMYVNPVYSPDYFSAKALNELSRKEIISSMENIKNNKSSETLKIWLENNSFDEDIERKFNEFMREVNLIDSNK